MEKQFPAHNAGRFSPSISILNLAALFKSKKRISPRFFQFCATARFPRVRGVEIGYFFNMAPGRCTAQKSRRYTQVRPGGKNSGQYRMCGV
jgi:hypothetical protein